jgi:hypothetical protein
MTTCAERRGPKLQTKLQNYGPLQRSVQLSQSKMICKKQIGEHHEKLKSKIRTPLALHAGLVHRSPRTTDAERRQYAEGGTRFVEPCSIAVTKSMPTDPCLNLGSYRCCVQHLLS